MGYSTYFYVGAFLKFNKPVEVMKKTEQRVCPSCDIDYVSGKFCIACGTAIITKTKEKKVELKAPYDILSHLGYDEDDVFQYYDMDIIIPNYRSNYNQTFNRGDEGKIILWGEMLKNKENAITEFRARGWTLIQLLDNNGIDYEITYGVTMYVY